MRDLLCNNINPIYTNIINLFVSVAIISDILHTETNRLLELFLMNYFIILLNNFHHRQCERFETENKTNHDLVKCTHAFFFVSLWFSIGFAQNLGIKYYLTALPLLCIGFYNNISENKSEIQYSNYIILIYYAIWCFLKKSI